MSDMPVRLEDRAIVEMRGADTFTLLERLVTVETESMAGNRYGALLTPQGKILFDFLLHPANDETILIDCHQSLVDDLIKRMMFYRLRAKADLRDVSADYAVVAAWQDRGDLPADPRLAVLGGRAIVPRAEVVDFAAGADAYRRHRMARGVAEAVSDFGSAEVFPHDAAYDLLHAVDFDKGCYVGQEVVSRTHHKAVVRKRFLPVDIEGSAPARGAAVMAGERVIGTMGGSLDGQGLALLRLDHLAASEGLPLMAGEARLRPTTPAWHESAPA